ncbi:MAG: hypothetical protein ACK5HY_03295 [Parahaliea sp.]
MKRIVMVVVLSLAGCESLPRWAPVSGPIVEACEITSTPIQLWLNEVEMVGVMTSANAQLALEAPENQGDAALLQFRRALLYQQLAMNEGWIQARDTLRQLVEDEHLDEQRVRLANVLLQYSQSMINAGTRRDQFSAELEAARGREETLAAEIRTLTAKIEALTHLEQSISERKSQGVNAINGI